DMKTPRVLISASVLAVLILGFFVVPLPVTRVRGPGLIMYQPDDMVPVHIAVPGILKKVYVTEGEYVTKGKVLAEFANPEMEVRPIKTKNNLTLRRELFTLNNRRFREAGDPREKQSAQQSRTQAEGERNAAQRNLELLDRELDKLVLR